MVNTIFIEYDQILSLSISGSFRLRIELIGPSSLSNITGAGICTRVSTNQHASWFWCGALCDLRRSSAGVQYSCSIVLRPSNVRLTRSIFGSGLCRCDKGIDSPILEAGFGSPGKVLDADLQAAGRCSTDVGGAASGAGAVQSRATGAQERLSRRNSKTSKRSSTNPHCALGTFVQI